MNHDFPYDLTVVTVCWNALQVLPRCIESVQPLYQTSLKVEHLFIDGASTDGTLEYLQQQLTKGKITRIISEPDKGLYDAMNKAINNAQGKIIVFINADDAICPEGAIACCEPILAGRAEYTAGQALCISSDASKKNYIIRPKIKNTLWRQPYCHQSMFCSTTLLREMGGFLWEKFRIGADAELIKRLYIAGKPFEAVNKIAAHFYTGGVSYSPATRTEVYELMMHFKDAYCQAAADKPGTAVLTLKHLRRYTARMILEHRESNTLSDTDKKQISEFVGNLAQALPAFSRKLICLHQQLLTLWYMVCALFASTRKKNTHLLHAEISRIFVTCLKGL